MDEFSERILVALVEGDNARAGLKDRNRALTEYEIARRAGFTGFSYVEFSLTPEREQVRSVLDELARGGWVREWARAGRYDSFVPTELGVRRASTFAVIREGPGAEPTPPAAVPWAGTGAGAAQPGDGYYGLDEQSPRPPMASDGLDLAAASEPWGASTTPAGTADPPVGRSSLLRRPALGARTGPLTAEAALNRLVEQLDEALLLLRAIDAKLGRDR